LASNLEIEMFSSDNREGILFARKRSPAGLGEMFAGAAFATLLSIGLMTTEARADDDCGRLAKSYLVNVISGGSLASREVLTLTHDGKAFTIDSNQGGVTGVSNPFSSEQGSWSCHPDNPVFQATATVIDFCLTGTVPGGPSLARIDYKISSNPGSKAISGTIDLRFFPLKGDPLVNPLPPPAASFTFTGVPIK
jgi:hypothetical protein